MENNALQHHGIKNMRWGIRRFQRKDGSLTALGRRRKRQNEEDNDESKKSESLEQKKQRVLSSHSAKELYKNKDLFDDKELQSAFIRLNTERNIKNMIPEEVSAGKKFINTYVNTGKTVKDVVDTSESLYNSYQKAKRLINTLSAASTET